MRSGPRHPGAFTDTTPFEPENETEKKLSAVTSKSVENVPLPDTPIGLAKAIEAKRTRPHGSTGNNRMALKVFINFPSRSATADRTLSLMLLESRCKAAFAQFAWRAVRPISNLRSMGVARVNADMLAWPNVIRNGKARP